MSKKSTYDPWAEDERISREHAERLEERRKEPLTRESVIGAIESVALQYGCNGTHESSLIAEAFRALAEELR